MPLPRTGRCRPHSWRRAAARTRPAPRTPRPPDFPPRRTPRERRPAAARPAPRRNGRARSRRTRSPPSPFVGAILGDRPVVLALGVQQLLVEVQPLMVKRVSHPLRLRAQIRLVVGVWRVLDRDLRAHRQAVALESLDLLRVVREDADRAEPDGG